MALKVHIDQLCQLRGITRAELSRRSGVHINTLYFYASGGRVPKIDVLLKLAKALSCSLDDLISDDELK